MKVLSIRQPWASLIINGYKNYEFRSWRTKFRGRVLIHASGGIERDYVTRFKSLNLDYPTSAILGVVEITDCVEVTSAFEEDLISKNEMVYGATKGRAGYAFKIENATKFDEPIPANGNLSFWDFYEPEEVMTLMDELKYGFIGTDYIFYEYLNSKNASKYKLSLPKETLKKKCGVCWDQVELERSYLRNNKLDMKTVFIYYEDGIDDESHTFLTYKKKGKYYWFEHAWQDYKGMHEYDTMDDLLNDVKKKFLSMLNKKELNPTCLHAYIYSKPKFSLTVEEFYEHCKNGEKIDL